MYFVWMLILFISIKEDIFTLNFNYMRKVLKMRINWYVMKAHADTHYPAHFSANSFRFVFMLIWFVEYFLKYSNFSHCFFPPSFLAVLTVCICGSFLSSRTSIGDKSGRRCELCAPCESTKWDGVQSSGDSFLPCRTKWTTACECQDM